MAEDHHRLVKQELIDSRHLLRSPFDLWEEWIFECEMVMMKELSWMFGSFLLDMTYRQNEKGFHHWRIGNKSITWLCYFNYRYVDFCIGNSMQMRNLVRHFVVARKKVSCSHLIFIERARARSEERTFKFVWRTFSWRREMTQRCVASNAISRRLVHN